LDQATTGHVLPLDRAVERLLRGIDVGDVDAFHRE